MGQETHAPSRLDGLGAGLPARGLGLHAGRPAADDGKIRLRLVVRLPAAGVLGVVGDELRRLLAAHQKVRLGRVAGDVALLVEGGVGIALGVDRLVMLLVGATSIEDVVLFPASELFGK